MIKIEKMLIKEENIRKFLYVIDLLIKKIK